MKKLFITLLLLTMIFFSCGVNKKVHQKALRNLAYAHKNYMIQQQENSKLKKKLAALQDELNDTNQKNVSAGMMIESLLKQLKKTGASLEEIEAKQAKMKSQRGKLMEELKQIRKLKEAAERRNAEFKRVMEKLKSMVDAGKLLVRVRKGRMMVSLSSDILFPSGGTKLTSEGKEAITELSETLKTLEGRSFLVVGHSDSTPIKTKMFPSNWELSSKRAIEVTRLMIKNGVKPETLSAAGQAQFDPVAKNNTPSNKAKNRRVEIVFIPKIEEFPGFVD